MRSRKKRMLIWVIQIFSHLFFVSSDLPQAFLVVGGAAGAQQPVLPQGWGPVCGAEDRRTGRPQLDLRLTVPPENSHTAHHAPTSFLRSGRFSALRRSTNRNYDSIQNVWLVPHLDHQDAVFWGKNYSHWRRRICIKLTEWWATVIQREVEKQSNGVIIMTFRILLVWKSDRKKGEKKEKNCNTQKRHYCQRRDPTSVS